MRTVLPRRRKCSGGDGPTGVSKIRDLQSSRVNAVILLRMHTSITNHEPFLP
ncbi:hypothetical protein EGR_10653 [Echinococcus granulosus]|uniref:Uncharacterized protein n=1 Tax=Echinococcus granulosus TaxID=6210 RepID=W6U073_ECHGR|nr:hypothetical protein EGR_10653 [Echinococcus granulosus]EUB54485.1 hypothetical protein EGR_10653 [Echinococcus granulosus]